MSMYGNRCEIFEKVLDSLIDEQPWIDGLDLADILQRAAVKVMKESLSGLDGDARNAALVGLIDTAQQELAAALVASSLKTNGAYVPSKDCISRVDRMGERVGRQ